MSCVVRVVGAADGSRTPHDGKFVKAWDAHVRFGILELTSTDDIAKARRFNPNEALTEWQSISRVQPVRPDGEPNKPLTGISIELVSLK